MAWYQGKHDNKWLHCEGIQYNYLKIQQELQDTLSTLDTSKLLLHLSDSCNFFTLQPYNLLLMITMMPYLYHCFQTSYIGSLSCKEL